MKPALTLQLLALCGGRCMWRQNLSIYGAHAAKVCVWLNIIYSTILYNITYICAVKMYTEAWHLETAV